MATSLTSYEKRAHAVTGDLVSLSHPTVALDAPFTSHVDIAYRGVTHQVLTMQSRRGVDFTHTTGEFTVNGMRGFIIEAIDTVATQGTHRYQAVVESDHGVLSTYSYLDVADLLAMVGALAPVGTNLGMVVNPTDDVEITTTAKLALSLPVGVLECTPLTSEVTALLPQWAGTTVANGELFAGHLASDAPFLTLVTTSARALLMSSDAHTADAGAEFMADLAVAWTS